MNLQLELYPTSLTCYNMADKAIVTYKIRQYNAFTLPVPHRQSEALCLNPLPILVGACCIRYSEFILLLTSGNSAGLSNGRSLVHLKKTVCVRELQDSIVCIVMNNDKKKGRFFQPVESSKGL